MEICGLASNILFDATFFEISSKNRPVRKVLGLAEKEIPLLSTDGRGKLRYLSPAY